MNRPKFNDEMRKELAQIMGKVVSDWCQDTELEQCIEDSYDVLKWTHNSDGYELAKELDSKGYSPDSILVSDLDHISWDARRIEQRYIEQWVIDNGLKLDIAIGTEVKYNEWGNKFKVGKIVKHYPETLQYGVRTPEQSETSNYIVNAEKVTLV